MPLVCGGIGSGSYGSHDGYSGYGGGDGCSPQHLAQSSEAPPILPIHAGAGQSSSHHPLAATSTTMGAQALPSAKGAPGRQRQQPRKQPPTQPQGTQEQYDRHQAEQRFAEPSGSGAVERLSRIPRPGAGKTVRR